MTGAIERRRLLALAAAAGAAGLLPRAALARAKSHARRKPHRIPLVAIDPGHGGIDPGAISVTGAYEKDIVLATARHVAKRLEASGRARVFLTRSTDEFIPLHDRVARTRHHGADLFLSIHADSIPDPEVRGASVFTLSDKASDAIAAALAKSENDADRVGGVAIADQPPDVGRILIDLVRRRTANLSTELALAVVETLRPAVPLLDPCHRSAGFVVLKDPDVPSVLVEIGCLSNRQEDRNLRSAAYRRHMAEHIATAVRRYVETAAI